MQQGKKEVSERLSDLDDKEKGLEDREKALDTERTKIDAREIVVGDNEETLRKDEKAYTDKLNILKLQQAEVKVEEKKIEEIEEGLGRKRCSRWWRRIATWTD